MTAIHPQRLARLGAMLDRQDILDCITRISRAMISPPQAHAVTNPSPRSSAPGVNVMTFGGESMLANATTDLAASRDRRRKTGLSNVLVRQPFQAAAGSHRDTVFRPAIRLSDGGRTRVPGRKDFSEMRTWISNG